MKGVIALFLLSILMISGCATPIISEKIRYTVSGCGEKIEGMTRSGEQVISDIKILDKRVEINQKVPSFCCADIKVRYEVEESTLRVYLDNEGEICRCVCTYDIEAVILESGIKKVEVHGVKYLDLYEYELLAEEPEAGEEIECSDDSDCVPASCCHASGCVPKSQAPLCRGILCSMECAVGTMDCGQGSCKCVDWKCEAVMN